MSDDSPQPETDTQPPEGASDPERREFMIKAASAVTGGVIVAVPVIAGLGTLVSPLTSGGQGQLKVRLAARDDLPEDGTPQLFQVVAERTDAWTKYPKKPLGSVFVRRLPDGGVVAFNSSCPHAGCSVGFESLQAGFYCPCHDSTFNIDGSRGPVCVSPRGMDELEVDQEKLAAGEVWVTFVNFKAGVADKVELS